MNLQQDSVLIGIRQDLTHFFKKIEGFFMKHEIEMARLEAKIENQSREIKELKELLRKPESE